MKETYEHHKIRNTRLNPINNPRRIYVNGKYVGMRPIGEPALNRTYMPEIRLAYPPPSVAPEKTGGKRGNADNGPGREYLIFPSWSANAIGGCSANLKRRIPGYKFEPGAPYEVWMGPERPQKKTAEKKLLSLFPRIGKSEWVRGATRELAAAYGMTRVPEMVDPLL